MVPPTTPSQEPIKHEPIKHEPQLHMQNDDQDLMNVVQLGFQVINSEKY